MSDRGEPTRRARDSSFSAISRNVRRLRAALSGMWMGVFYTRPLFDMSARLVFGGLMVTFILLGLRAVLRRDFTSHRAWMIRGYAVGIGAGTQVFTALVWLLVTGGATPDPNTTVLLLIAGWVINLTIAEIAIRRSAVSRAIA